MNININDVAIKATESITSVQATINVLRKGFSETLEEKEVLKKENLTLKEQITTLEKKLSEKK